MKKYLSFEKLQAYDTKIKEVIDTKSQEAAQNAVDAASGNYDAAGTAQTKVNELANGQVQTNTDSIATLNGTGEGSVAKAIADAKTELEGKITASESGLTEKVNTNTEDISDINDAIDTLNGSGEGSVAKTVDNAINEFAAKISDDGTVNTYKELIDYAAEHGAEFTELVGEVSKNTTDIADVKATADGAVQDVATGNTEGTISVDGTDVSVNGYNDLKTSVGTNAGKISSLEEKVGEGFSEITTEEIESLFNTAE